MFKLLNSDKLMYGFLGNSLNQSEANATSVERVKPKPKVIIIRQPTCNELQHFDHVLEEVQQSLYHKYELCYPADIHNPLKHLVPSKGTPSDAIADSRGYFVVRLYDLQVCFVQKVVFLHDFLSLK